MRTIKDVHAKLDELDERIDFYIGLQKFPICIKELDIKENLATILIELKNEKRMLKLNYLQLKVW